MRECWKLHSCPHRLSFPIIPTIQIIPITQIIPIPRGEPLGTLVLQDLQSLAAEHCQSLWLSDGVGLHFFVPLAQFVCKRKGRASNAPHFYWMEIMGLSDRAFSHLSLVQNLNPQQLWVLHCHALEQRETQVQFWELQIQRQVGTSEGQDWYLA